MPVVATLVAGAAIVLVFSLRPLATEIPFAEASTITDGVKTFDQLSQRFEALADRKGGVYAYEVLRRAPLPPGTDLHLLGHTVGDRLYAQKGSAGIADCTQDFRNACSHSVVIGLLNEFGSGAGTLAKIDDACKAAPGGSGAYTMCYHGLGHGVFAYFGYDLARTADFCKKMGTDAYGHEQYTQCVGGAIMELMGGGGHDTPKWLAARERYLDPMRPLSPCIDAVVPEQAKAFCFMYLTPQLIERAGATLGMPDPAVFPKAFSFCEGIPAGSRELRDSCFGGFGKEFVPLAGARDIRMVDRFSDAEYAKAIAWCDLARPRDGKEACIEQALESVFWGGENDPAASLRFCALAPLHLQDACYGRLAMAMHRYLAGPELQRWCTQLPGTAASGCIPDSHI